MLSIFIDFQGVHISEYSPHSAFGAYFHHHLRSSACFILIELFPRDT